MSNLLDLPTPALLVDREKMLANARNLANHLAANGVSLRLHVKSCKNVDIARLCMDSETAPIAVSTLAEAEYFAAHGFRDILYAVGIAPQKLPRAMELRKKGSRLSIILDTAEAAQQVADFGRANRHAFDVLLEVDCDGHRGGFDAKSDALCGTAEILRAGGQNIAGVLTHSGSAYDLPNGRPPAFAELAEKERAAVVQAAQQLRDNGHESAIVSAGSTPTAIFGENYEGLTEVRAGVFMFNDCVMAGLGVCDTDDIAISVLCAVIGKRVRDGAIIVDAGWSALSSDRGIASRFPHYGYGLVCDIEGNVIPHLRVCELNQEHGIICPRPGFPAPEMPVGTYLRVLPVHACAAANGFGDFHFMEDGKASAALPRCRGW